MAIYNQYSVENAPAQKIDFTTAHSPRVDLSLIHGSMRRAGRRAPVAHLTETRVLGRRGLRAFLRFSLLAFLRVLVLQPRVQP
jgi:hypothetical protein